MSRYTLHGSRGGGGGNKQEEKTNFVFFFFFLEKKCVAHFTLAGSDVNALVPGDRARVLGQWRLFVRVQIRVFFSREFFIFNLFGFFTAEKRFNR